MSILQAGDTEMAEAAEDDEEEGEATLEENDAMPPQEEPAAAEVIGFKFTNKLYMGMSGQATLRRIKSARSA